MRQKGKGYLILFQNQLHEHALSSQGVCLKSFLRERPQHTLPRLGTHSSLRPQSRQVSGT